MFHPVDATALPGYKLQLRYSDGTAGEVDLSHLVGRGVFKVWEDYRVFEGVAIGEGGRIMWNDTIDMCPDALYLKLTGKAPEQVFRM